MKLYEALTQEQKGKLWRLAQKLDSQERQQHKGDLKQ